MNYKNRQVKAKLENWYICHKLNLKYKDYVNVKTGKRNLANNKLDLFLELTKPEAKEYINQDNEKRIIDKWYVDNSSKDIKKLMKEFKVDQRIMAKDLGCDGSGISRAIKWSHEPSNIKYLVYYYLKDENNRRNVYEGKKPGPKAKTKEEIIEEITKTNNLTPEPSFTIGNSKIEHTDNGTIITSELDSEVLEDTFIPTPEHIEITAEPVEEPEPIVERKEPVGISFVKKDDYDRLVREKEELEKELKRYKYLIDLAMNK